MNGASWRRCATRSAWGERWGGRASAPSTSPASHRARLLPSGGRFSVATPVEPGRRAGQPLGRRCGRCCSVDASVGIPVDASTGPLRPNRSALRSTDPGSSSGHRSGCPRAVARLSPGGRFQSFLSVVLVVLVGWPGRRCSVVALRHSVRSTAWPRTRSVAPTGPGSSLSLSPGPSLSPSPRPSPSGLGHRHRGGRQCRRDRRCRHRHQASAVTVAVAVGTVAVAGSSRPPGRRRAANRDPRGAALCALTAAARYGGTRRFPSLKTCRPVHLLDSGGETIE